jgi:hypothetical protein
MPYQLSVFIENRPGRLERICEVLHKTGINIRAMTLATSSAGWGVLNLLVNRPEQAKDALCASGHSAALRRIVVVEMPDRPGGLHEVIALLAQAGLNVENAYGTVLREGTAAILVVDVEKTEQAQDVFARAGVKLLDDAAVYSI